MNSSIFMIDKRDNTVYCDVGIPTKNKRRLETLKFKFDTGASVTLIPTSILQRMGYTQKDFDSDRFSNTKISIADGSTVQALTTVLPQISIGDNIFHNIHIVCPEKGKLLLGLDLLQVFDFKISFPDKGIDYKFRGIDGKGSIIKPITGKEDDFCAYEITAKNSGDTTESSSIKPLLFGK